MQNIIDGVVLLGFALCLEVFWHAKPMPLVEICYYLRDNRIEVSSKKQLVCCILKLNALLLFAPDGPGRVSSISGGNMESTK